MQAKLLSPSVLAFVGDGVYGLKVRERLALVNRPSGELHRLSVQLVNAAAQQAAYETISPLLTEEEQDIFRRGRNAHTSSAPKHMTRAQYHCATGLEALFGWLYLDGQLERLDTLFSNIWEAFSGTLE